MTDEELREMQERVVQIGELQTHQSWPIYEDWLRHKLQIATKRVLKGDIKSLDDYREEVGFVKGLTIAIKALDDVTELVSNEIKRKRERADEVDA